MKIIWALAGLSLTLSGCHWFETKKSEKTSTAQNGASRAAARSPKETVAPDIARQKHATADQAEPVLPKSVALDLDGDGAPDSVRAAPVGEYAVSAPMAFKDGTGAITEPVVDWKQTALVVRLSSSAEQAINFAHVRSMQIVSPKDTEAARNLGCTLPQSGQALIAASEEGAMLIHFQDGRLIADACGS